MILVCQDRFSDTGLTEDFYDIGWNHLDVARPHHSNARSPGKKPALLANMLKLSALLSKGMPFVRVDFYCISGRVYFGELTFYPASGFEAFVPTEYDLLLGSWITLPENKNHDKYFLGRLDAY